MSKLKVLTNLDNKQNLYVSGTHNIYTSGSFNASISTTQDGMYSVDEALHVLDSVIEENYNNVQAAYDNVRFQYTGTFDSNGEELLNLTSLAPYGSTYFTNQNLTDVNIQVLVDTEGDSHYKNDLLSLELYASGNYLMVKLEAPGSPNKPYRLSAINETILPI